LDTEQTEWKIELCGEVLKKSIQREVSTKINYGFSAIV